MARRGKFWLGLGLGVMTAFPAQADRRSWVCEFPNVANKFIASQMTITYNPQSDTTMVSDAIIEKMVGAAVKAESGQKRTGPQVYSWRIQGWSRQDLFLGWLSYRLKIQVDGRAFVDATNENQRFSAKGRCK